LVILRGDFWRGFRDRGRAGNLCIISLSLGAPDFLATLVDRQFDDEGGAGRAGAFHVNPAQVFLNDAVADGQPQAHSLAYLLGGEEGIEEPAEIVGRDAGAV